MRHLLVLTLIAALLSGGATAQDAAKAKVAAQKLTTKWLEPMQWRSIGPANMGGRITSVAVYEKDPCKWWVATASGGLLKTVNNGATFEHQFDRENVVSIGDVAVAQSDEKIVWVGTGEGNPRNSVSWGNGVYKSVDGGKTWKHMGLEGAFQISSVRVHPDNPDIVYVGALGRLWGPGGERGLYKTTDGGKSWKRIHFVDDKTGVIDVQMHPGDPDTLMVATYERQRDGFDTNAPAKKHAAGSGLYKTTDGGKTFQEITKGLPTCKLGRIGLDYYRKDPNTIVMVLESEKIGNEPENAPYVGITGTDADAGARMASVLKGGPAEKAGLKKDDIVLSVDGTTVHSYADFLRLVRQHVSGDTIELELSRARKSVTIKVQLGSRPKPKPKAEPKAKAEAKPKAKAEATQAEAKPEPKAEAKPKAKAKAESGKKGKAQPQRARQRRRTPFGAFLGGQRPNFQDQQGKQGHEFGGIYKSTDGGESWTRINSLNPRPMYFSEIRIDPSDDKKLWVLGIRLWKSLDGGKKFTNDGHGRGVHVDHHAMWVDPADGRHVILGNDGGLYTTWDHGKNWTHHNTVAIGQFYHVAVGPRRNYRVYGGLQDNGSWGGPGRVAHASGPGNTDWMRIGGGDGFVCRVDPNDPDQIYFESQNGAVGRRHLVKADRAGFRPRPPKGERYRFNWQTPFVLSSHNTKIYYTAGNHVFRSLDRGNHLKVISPEITHGDRGSATTLAESPRDADVLYVGTDDGALWMTRDGGHTWTDLYAPAAKTKKPEVAAKTEPATAPAGSHPNGNGDGNDDGDKVKKDEPAKPTDPVAETQKPKPADEKKDEPKKPAEAPLPPAAQRMIDRMLDMDTNGDGSLQKSEMPERALNMFERLDANKDGVIDPEELNAMARRMANRRGAGRRGAGRGGARRNARESAPASKADDKKKAPPGKRIEELVPDRRWVNHIEASRFATGRAYVVFDGHRSDDDRQHIYVTEDFGKTFRSLLGDLPGNAGTTRVLREDPKNENLLYLGTEFGAWVSIDRGAHWVSLKTNLPTVAVHAFAIHPTANEIVAATHGRSLWVLDVTMLRQLSQESLTAPVTLFAPNKAVQWRPGLGRGRARGFTGRNPSSGAEIFFALAKKTEGATLEIQDLAGKLVRTLAIKGEAGLNHVSWNLRRERRKGRRGRFGPRVRPGTFKVVLKVGEQIHTQPLYVEIDPDHTDERWIAAADLEEEIEAERAEASSRRKFPWKHDLGDD